MPTAPPAGVFISYRRDDAAGYARAVHDALAAAFGAERVFMDVEDIGAGQAFGEVIERAVGGAGVLLVLMGRRWAGPREGAPPRLADPEDFVRREVAAALAQGRQVVPVLLDGATMPAAAELPEPLRALAGHHALALDGARFTADMARLVDALRPLLGQAPGSAATPTTTATSAPRRRTWALGAAAALAALTALAGAGLLWRGGEPAAPQPAARPAINGHWQAEIVYPWPNARYTERFSFSGEGEALQGTASFLRVPRTLQEGRVTGSTLGFVTRTAVEAGDRRWETVHRYQGRLQGERLELVLQTEGGDSATPPVTISAIRVGQ